MMPKETEETYADGSTFVVRRSVASVNRAHSDIDYYVDNGQTFGYISRFVSFSESAIERLVG